MYYTVVWMIRRWLRQRQRTGASDQGRRPAPLQGAETRGDLTGRRSGAPGLHPQLGPGQGRREHIQKYTDEPVPEPGSPAKTVLVEGGHFLAGSPDLETVANDELTRKLPRTARELRRRTEVRRLQCKQKLTACKQRAQNNRSEETVRTFALH